MKRISEDIKNSNTAIQMLNHCFHQQHKKTNSWKYSLTWILETWSFLNTSLNVQSHRYLTNWSNFHFQVFEPQYALFISSWNKAWRCEGHSNKQLDVLPDKLSLFRPTCCCCIQSIAKRLPFLPLLHCWMLEILCSPPSALDCQTPQQLKANTATCEYH